MLDSELGWVSEIMRRTLLRNKSILHYSNYEEHENAVITDSEGNILESGENDYYYSEPKKFKAYITSSGNDVSQSVEYGMDMSDYNAMIIVPKNTVPLKEGSLVWHETEPETNNIGYAVKSSADYEVKRKLPSLNVDKYLLKRLK